MQTIKRLARAYEKANTVWGEFVGFWIFVITAIICYEVIARYIFNAPTIWAAHLAQQVFGGFIVMGGAYALIHGAHTRMDLIYNRLPGDRARAILDIFTSSLFFIFVIVLLVQMIPYVWHATLMDRKIHSWIWDAREWPMLWCIPVASFLLLIQGIIVFVRNVAKASRGGK